MNLWKTDTSELREQIADLAQRVRNLSESHERAERDLTALRGRVDDLTAQVSREALSMAELYDKTYHLLKRHEARERKAASEELEAEPEPKQQLELEGTGTDPVTARVLQRRRRDGGVSPILPG